MLVCRGLLPLARRSFWSHPHLDFDALYALLDGGDGRRLQHLAPYFEDVRHLTVHPGRQLDSFARDEEAALDCRLPELLSHCPHLWSLSLLDVPMFKGFDAVVLLETLRLASGVKKLRLELLLMNLAIEAPGHLLNAAERCSRPDRTVVGSIKDPADVIQPFGLEGQARDFRARPDEMAEWWSSVLNEQTRDGQRADMMPRALTQRPRYVADGAYPNPVPDEPATEDWQPYVPPELEAPESLQKDGEWDIDAITKAEYAAMMGVVYCRDTGKRQAAARWLSDRPQFAVTGRTFGHGDVADDYAALPLNLHDARKQLALKLRWRLLNHLRAHTPESMYLVFKDPAAAMIAHEPYFWQALPVPHVRIRMARGLEPDDAFALESSATCVPARELRLGAPSSAGTGGGTVTLWKTTTSRRAESYPLHPRTRQFELVCNSAKDLEGLKAPHDVRVLLGEGDQDWRAVEPGVALPPMSEEKRDEIIKAYRDDFKKHFGGQDEYVSYGMVDEFADSEEWGSDSDPGPWAEFGHEDDEIIGTPPPDSDEDGADGDGPANPPNPPDPDNAANGAPATGPAPGGNMTAPPQPLLLPIQVHLQQQVQTLLHQHLAQMAHEQAQMAAQRQARLATHAQFVQRVQELQAQLAAVEAMELTPGQAAAQAAAQNQLEQVQQAVALHDPVAAAAGPAGQAGDAGAPAGNGALEGEAGGEQGEGSGGTGEAVGGPELAAEQVIVAGQLADAQAAQAAQAMANAQQQAALQNAIAQPPGQAGQQWALLQQQANEEALLLQQPLIQQAQAHQAALQAQSTQAQSGSQPQSQNPPPTDDGGEGSSTNP